MEVIEKVFPNTTEITSLGKLEIGGCDVQNLAQKYGTPFYIFDSEHIENVCDTYNTEFISRYQNTQVVYGAKAFANKSIVWLITLIKFLFDLGNVFFDWDPRHFYKGVFYKPETLIKIRKDIKVFSTIKNIKFKKYFNQTKILSPFKLNINYKKYQKIFDVFSKKIKQGETYQIKVCTKYKNKSQINPINFFWKLMKINSSPEAFMIRDKDFSIVSCSPETLIDKKGNNIITKPIAGTLRKNKNINKFKALNFFKNNDKETKEHNMIVDMERSDLSRICKPGSVKILKQKYVEEYKHLFHYVTTIQGKLRNKIKIKNIIKSMMPGGSVIGCPKIRTLELLNKQETEDRNIFTGSFGYIKFNQDMRFNIIIRSILNFKNISEISAASGIVLESSPKKEFNENFIKAKSLLDLYKWFIL